MSYTTTHLYSVTTVWVTETYAARCGGDIAKGNGESLRGNVGNSDYHCTGSLNTKTVLINIAA